MRTARFPWTINYQCSNINVSTRDTSAAENSSNSDLRDLLSELDLLKKLKPHPNVIQLLGCFTKDVIRCKGRHEFSKFVEAIIIIITVIKIDINHF